LNGAKFGEGGEKGEVIEVRKKGKGKKGVPLERKKKTKGPESLPQNKKKEKNKKTNYD